jgi:predicted phosphohydrolase
VLYSTVLSIQSQSRYKKKRCEKSYSRLLIGVHYPNIEDMPDVTSVDKIVEVKRVSLV